KSAQWYPGGYWDWFYGPGYWWYSYDYDWYPGWRSWGCKRPRGFWWGRSYQQPEVVLENTVQIGKDGTVKVVIDTALAKAMHGHTDHNYSITAEVVDDSRRTIVGSGSVIVARKPFKVYSWVDRGYYNAGDTITASFSARTSSSKPVKGKAKVTLFKVGYDEKGKVKETEVQSWNLETNAQGKAEQKMKAATAGQYRISIKVTDSKGHTEEGGYVFAVRGQDFNDGADYRFNALEIINDKREYNPGDKVKLMINTNRVGSTVLLFTRPSNGVYGRPIMLKLKGKSTIHEIPVTIKDMPNFFVEAVTISNGKVHTQLKELVVPPAKRIMNVELVPSSKEYKPGEKAKVKVKLTGENGKPYVGSVVLSVYDKAVEYISGGSNVGEIKSFFWKWRRSHYP
ncbi:MAG: alpha-2-macroglobulin, partial [Planctomycetota bacterium]|nr:alpha-2-macroglobulin [Planctomycetota bacterium]